MPISPYDTRSEKNPVILGIQNIDGKEIIKIRDNGDIEIDENIKTDEAAIEFWQNVSDMLPADKDAIVRDKIMLIKTFAKMREIMESARVTKESLVPMFQELEDHFLRI